MSTSKTLYELKEKYDEFFDHILPELIDEETGEIPEEASQRMDLITDEIETKVKNTALFIKNQKVLLAGYDTELRRLRAAKKSLTDRIDWAYGYIAANAPEGMDMKTPELRLYFQLSEFVDVPEGIAGSLADEFVITKLTVSPDKKAIKEYWKSSEPDDELVHAMIDLGVSIRTRRNAIVR